MGTLKFVTENIVIYHWINFDNGVFNRITFDNKFSF